MDKQRVLRIYVIAVLAFSMALSSAFAGDTLKRERNPGDPAENAKKDGLEGKVPPALEGLTGWTNTKDGSALTWPELEGKVILIDFWGVWCGPCRSAIPHLKELSKKYAEQGLIVVGIHTKNSAKEGPTYVQEEKIPYPIAYDTNGNVISRFHVDSFPDYYLIDHKGLLRFADLSNGEVDKAIEMLLEERNGND